MTPWIRVIPEKLTVPQIVKNFPHFIEFDCLLQHSQVCNLSVS